MLGGKKAASGSKIALVVFFLSAVAVFTMGALSNTTEDTSRQTFGKPANLYHAPAAQPKASVEGNQVAVSPADGGIAPPTFPRPRLAIFAPLNWPRDQFKIRAIDQTWQTVADIVYYSTSSASCEEMRKDDFHPQETKDRFMCLNMTGSDEYGKGMKRNIWEKSWRSWVQMLEKHIDDAEFFMKCDSDTFVAVENMKTYLQYFDPEKEWYFGHTLLHEWQMNVIFNTGIGYVISRATARRLLPHLKAMTETCPYARACCQMPGPNEDAHMGSCLMELNILPTNTFDKEGRIRFLSFRPEDHVTIYREPTWYWKFKPTDIKEGPECCSPYPVVMHNYKEQDSLSIFQELMRRFHDTPNLNPDHPRISEVPDQNLFRYNEDELNFAIDKNRKLCSETHGEGCPA